MAKLAFYKSQGSFHDKAIRWWLNSQHSHVEIVTDCNTWVTASPRDGGVVARQIIVDDTHWDYINIPNVSDAAVFKHYDNNQDREYDWSGIFLTHVLPLGLHSKRRRFCSEFVAELLGLPNPHKWNPHDLFILTSNARRLFVTG